MARPILKTKNTDLLQKRASYAKKVGSNVFSVTTPHTKKERESTEFDTTAKGVRAEYGLPFTIIDCLSALEAEDNSVVVKFAKAIADGQSWSGNDLAKLKRGVASGRFSPKTFVAAAAEYAARA